MKRTFTIILPIVLIMLSVISAAAQLPSLLKSGIQVEILTTNIIGAGKPISSVSEPTQDATNAARPASWSKGPNLTETVATDGDTVRRFLVDKSNKVAYGYDLVIERVPGTEDVLVSVKPISKTPVKLSKGGGLPNFVTIAGNLSVKDSSKGSAAVPVSGRGNLSGARINAESVGSEPVTIKIGGTISVTLMQNPETGARLEDVIRISDGSERKFERARSGYNEFASSYASTAADFSLNNLNLTLTEPRVVLSGASYDCSICSASSRLVWIYIEGKGRFIFSIQPEPGFDFRKAGVVDENKITFEHNGEIIGIENTSRVLPSKGKFNLWVMYDANYRPAFPLSPSLPITLGSGSNVTQLLNVANGRQLP